MKAIVDRIEGGLAILILCEDRGTIIRLPGFMLPEILEGDIIDLVITRDMAATRAARDNSRNLISRLDKKNVNNSLLII